MVTAATLPMAEQNAAAAPWWVGNFWLTDLSGRLFGAPVVAASLIQVTSSANLVGAITASRLVLILTIYLSIDGTASLQQELQIEPHPNFVNSEFVAGD